MTAPPALPYRLMSRLTNEMHLDATMAIQALMPDDYDRAVILLTLMRLGAPDWTVDGALTPPAAPGRFGSINALATSLRRPYETVRRHIRALVAAGLCIEAGAGVAISPAAATAKIFCRTYARVHDVYLRLVQDMAAAGLLDRPPPALGPPPLGQVVATAIDAMLMPFELFIGGIGSWQSMEIWMVVATANTRAIMLDPVLNARYAHASTPDYLRRPLPARAIMRTLGLSYGTVWRHLRALEARGALTRTDDGWIVRVAQLRDPAMEARVVGCMHYHHRRAAALVIAGLRAAAPPYLDGRPPLVPIG